MVLEARMRRIYGDVDYMRFRQIIKAFIPPSVLKKLRGLTQNIDKYVFEGPDVRKDIEEKYHYSGDLLDLFADNKDFIVHKWHHYIPLYDRYFAPFRGRKIKFLEIGVSKGGSLQMWRKYFGDEAILFGIDIDSTCVQYNGLAGQVRIGSQADTNFLESVVREMGGVDIVLDDGSHHMEHIPVSLKYLFPYLSDGGIYMIEDLHTAYWKKWGGGYGVRKNFFATILVLINDMHHWYHSRGLKLPEISYNCSGIHIHDSIVVLEKSKVHKLVHSCNG